MTIIIVKEILMDIRNMFRGWRLVLHLAILSLVTLASCSGEEGLAGYMMVMYCIFSSSSRRPRLIKLFYLLPTQMGDRCNYILLKCFAQFLHSSLLYLIAITIAVLLTDYQFAQEVPTIVSYVVPIFIAYGGLSMGNGYQMGKTHDEHMTKRYQKRYSVSAVMAILALCIALLSNLSFLWGRLPDFARIIITIISYCFAFTSVGLQISVLRHTELSEENVRKYEKLLG